jgi:hypothetical protein
MAFFDLKESRVESSSLVFFKETMVDLRSQVTEFFGIIRIVYFS